MAISIKGAYSGFFDAARTRDGFVVASWALYFSIVLKSPESQTTVVPVALSCSREFGMMCCYLGESGFGLGYCVCCDYLIEV